MKYYRIVFARNEIIYCDEMIDQLLRDFPIFEENKGQVIFALVKAQSVAEATRHAEQIRDKVLDAHRQQTQM